jgi:hypothetical protein
VQRVNTTTSWVTDDDANIRLTVSGNQTFKQLGVQQSDTYVAVEVDGTMVLVKMDLSLK